MASLISDPITPKILPDIEILTYRGAQLLVANLHPNSNRPHFLKSNGVDGGTSVRLGSSNRKADADLIEDVKHFSQGQTFDEIVMLPSGPFTLQPWIYQCLNRLMLL